jgi:hypothetical protein
MLSTVQLDACHVMRMVQNGMSCRSESSGVEYGIAWGFSSGRHGLVNGKD